MLPTAGGCCPRLVGAPGGGGSLPSTVQPGVNLASLSQPAAGNSQAQAAVVCLQTVSAGRGPTPLPPLQELLLGIAVPPCPPPPPPSRLSIVAPQSSHTQPGTGSPRPGPHPGFRARKLCLGGQEQKAVTLWQVTPFLMAFLCRQSPRGQEVALLETAAGELTAAGCERLHSHSYRGSLLPAQPRSTRVVRAPPQQQTSCCQGAPDTVDLSPWRIAAGEAQREGAHLWCSPLVMLLSLFSAQGVS